MGCVTIPRLQYKHQIKKSCFRGIFASTDHTYKPLAEKPRDQHGIFLQIMANADFVNSTLHSKFSAKHVQTCDTTCNCPKVEEMDHACVTIPPMHRNFL